MATFPSPFQRWTKRCPGIDAELVAAAALLSAVLVLGLATAGDYGFTVDEFNTDDYGPKALAWYTSGFIDRSHFETVEFSPWYYGPWFQMLTAYLQSFDFADRITVRHAMTFLVGLAGVAALLPLGRLAAGRWVGLAAITLCLMTGYLYGSLFFTPIDVPFLAAMTKAASVSMFCIRHFAMFAAWLKDLAGREMRQCLFASYKKTSPRARGHTSPYPTDRHRRG